MNLLSTKGLRYKRQESIIFSDVSFHLKKGEMLLVEGANGAGKSSLLRILAGFATPASGDVLWQEKSIYNSISHYQQQLHYMGHANGLRLDLTIAENINPCEQHFLSDLNLKKYIHTPTRMLSAGQKRKVALVKLFLSKKKLWLLDEPLTALDNETQLFFVSMLQHHLEQGGMAVMSSHQPIKLNMNMQSIKL